MKTIRVLSNVSFNSLNFFTLKINDLFNRGIIDWAYWIHHLPEDDELKEHIHFVFKPSSRIDTMDIRQFFYEYVNVNEKPLTCTPKFLPCNSIDDWLLYAVHDTAYLKSKGQFRKYHYNFTDLCSTDFDCLKTDWDNINRAKFLVLDFLLQAVENNIPFFQLVQDGLVPIAQRSQYEFQYKALFTARQNEIANETGRFSSHDVMVAQMPLTDDFDDVF